MDIATLFALGFMETEIDLEYSRSVTVDGESVTVKVMQDCETKMWGITVEDMDIHPIVQVAEVIDFMVDIRADL